MASTQDYLDYVLENLRNLDGITCKRMMGEYLLYYRGTLFGGVYDNRFLIKKTKSLEDKGLKEVIPYPGAKAMLLVDSESPGEIEELVLAVSADLAAKAKYFNN